MPVREIQWYLGSDFLLDSALIKTLIKERSELEPNDSKVNEYWERMTELLSVNIIDPLYFDMFSTIQ